MGVLSLVCFLCNRRQLTYIPQYQQLLFFLRITIPWPLNFKSIKPKLLLWFSYIICLPFCLSYCNLHDLIRCTTTCTVYHNMYSNLCGLQVSISTCNPILILLLYARYGTWTLLDQWHWPRRGGKVSNSNPTDINPPKTLALVRRVYLCQWCYFFLVLPISFKKVSDNFE